MEPKQSVDAASVHSVVHTPGPWTIEPHGKGFALYSGRDNQHHGMNLVYLTEPDWNWDANAKLIEDAPRLLEVLRELRDFAQPTTHHRYRDRAAKAFDDATKILQRHGG